MPTVRLFNPRRRKTKRGPSGQFLKRKRNRRPRTHVKHQHRRQKRNPFPGGTLTYMANPKRHRRRNRIHVKHRRRRNPIFGKARRAKNTHRRHRHSNPIRVHRRRRRNPVIFGVDAGTIARQAGWAILGGITTRSVPATVLGATNTGVVGYLSNAAIALVGGGLLGRFMGAEAGSAFVLGGSVMLAGRLVEDFLKKQLVSFTEYALPLPHLGADPLYNMGGPRLSGDYARVDFPVPYASSDNERLLRAAGVPAATPPRRGVGSLGLTPGTSPSGGGVWRGPWQN